MNVVAVVVGVVVKLNLAGRWPAGRRPKMAANSCNYNIIIPYLPLNLFEPLL